MRFPGALYARHCALRVAQLVRIAMVAGEASGDTLGAGLMVALRELHPQAEFVGVGGARMAQAGFQSLAPQELLNLMGFVAPLLRLPALLRLRRRLRRHFLRHPPAVFVGIDSPSFNLGLEEALARRNIPTVHYVSPSLWAWRAARLESVRRAARLVLTLFPFEEDYYRARAVAACCVGHPLADRIPLEVDRKAARHSLGLPEEGQVIALLPGSRAAEIHHLGEQFLRAAELCLRSDKARIFVLPAASAALYERLQQLLLRHRALHECVHLLRGRSLEALSACDAALVASGTASLEALLCKRPMVVAYRCHALNYAILSRLVRIPHVALPNILSGAAWVPELLQGAATPEALAEQLERQLEAGANPDWLAHARQLHLSLRRNADQRAAQAVLEVAQNG